MFINGAHLVVAKTRTSREHTASLFERGCRSHERELQQVREEMVLPTVYSTLYVSSGHCAAETEFPFCFVDDIMIFFNRLRCLLMITLNAIQIYNLQNLLII